MDSLSDFCFSFFFFFRPVSYAEFSESWDYKPATVQRLFGAFSVFFPWHFYALKCKARDL